MVARPKPMKWQCRFRQPYVFGGWSVAVLNLLSKARHRSGSDLHRPAGGDATAFKRLKLANEDQRERNAAVASAQAA